MSVELYKEFAEKKVFGGLDGLRFLSIVSVIWHHAVESHGSFKIGNYGFLGVDLFFVISGFLIVSLLLREKDKTGYISLKKFYIRRALRIFPLYYAVIFGLAFLYYFAARESQFGKSFLADLPIYLFYVANFYPVSFAIVWSLASEEQFYMIWPFLEKHFEKVILSILALLIVLNQVVNFYREPVLNALGLEAWAALSIMQATFTPILLGAALAHVLHKRMISGWMLKLISGRYNSIYWLLALLAVIQLSPSDISGLPRLIIQFLMLMLVASTVYTESHVLNKVLTLSPVARVGAISYGLYLFHIHGIIVARKVLDLLDINGQSIVFFLSMVITVIVAEVSFRYFEMPFLKIKERFSVVQQSHK